MKKTFLNSIIAIICLMAALPLMAPGCGDKEDINVGYYYIPVPGFDEADYLPMLNSGNEEIQYNAICYFTKGNGYDKYLTTDSLKETAKHDTALLLYQKIYALMNSKNSWVSSAAIRFISEFQYNRQAFVQYLLKNNNPSLNVQMEIIMDLTEDTAKDQSLFLKKINFLQQQPSWLLQNGSYLLMGEKDNVDVKKLMTSYNESNEEYKKLLILEVLTEHITDSVFLFLTNEWAVTRNERIKKIIFSNLPEAQNAQLVLHWFNEHYNLLEENMREMISRVSYITRNDIYGRLVVMALEKGWKPSSIIQEKEEDETEYSGQPVLYNILFLNKYETYTSDSIKIKQTPAGKQIENALLQNPALKKEWLVFEKRMLKYPLPMDLIKQHRQLTEEYLRQTELLLQQYQIDTALYHDFMHAVNFQAKELYEEKIRKQE